MTLDIRRIKKEECESLARIGLKAFPGGGNSLEGMTQWIEGTQESQNPDDVFYGAFRGDQLVGGTRYLNYQMNLLSQKVQLGGLGFVCVDLLHKKEKIAKEMMIDFLRHYRQQKVNLTMLYPFSLPFYKKMGFGYGTEMHKFQVSPTSFPKGETKEHLSYGTEADRDLLLDCYNRVAGKTNGMIFRDSFGLSNEVNCLVYKKDGQIKGYMLFNFVEAKKGYNYLLDLKIYNLTYENHQVLREFATFIHSQSDQTERVMYTTQDDSFRFFLTDPASGEWDTFKSHYLETYRTAQGALYRVTNVAGIFEEVSGHNFAGQDCRVKITVADTLLPENHGSIIIELVQGKVTSIDSAGEYDVEMTLDISDFSALLVGGVNFRGLLKYGLVTISDDSYINTLEQIFSADKPICTTYF